MRILIPIHHFPPRYTAGAELYTYRLARWLKGHGHHPIIVCIESVDSQRPLSLKACRKDLDEIEVWRLSLGIQGAARDWEYANPLVAGWLREQLITFQPDLLHLQSGYLIGAGVLDVAVSEAIPTVITLHDFWFICPRITLLRGDGQVCRSIPANPADCAWCQLLESRRFRYTDKATLGLVGKIAATLGLHDSREHINSRREFLHRTLASSDAVIAPSRFLANLFSGYVPAEKLHIQSLGLNTEHLAALPPPCTTGTLRLGYIGQISAHKGVHLLVRAMKHLPDHGRPVELTIYGDLHQHPNYSYRLRKEIGDDKRIRLSGRFENNQIADVFANIDTLIVPSIWFENSPLAILEAQAAGRPVIASAMGGMAELVRHEVDGLHFQPGNAEDLAHQIQRLREQPELLQRLHQSAHRPPTVDQEMEGILKIYHRVQQQAALLKEAL